MNRHDYMKTDKFIRNHLDKDQALRIELNSEFTLYPTREFLDAIKHFISLQDICDDKTSRIENADNQSPRNSLSHFL